MKSGHKNASLLGHSHQTSMLSVLAECALEYVTSEVKSARFYTIIVDETKDVSHKEELTLVLCYVLKGVIHERFSHCKDLLNAAAPTYYIYKALDSIHLDIEDRVSQYYDGASVTNGATMELKLEYCRTIQGQTPVDHCHNHLISLSWKVFMFLCPQFHSLFLTRQK